MDNQPLSTTQKIHSLRHKIYDVFQNSGETKIGILLGIIVIALILISTISFCIESLPKYHDNNTDFFIIETVCVVGFTIEYLTRLLCCRKKDLKKFLFAPLNIVDLLAILPYWIELIVGDSVSAFTVVRVIRLARIFRIFKVGRYTEAFGMVTETVKRSIEGLYLLLFFMGLGIVLFSSLIFYAEQTEADFDKKTQQWIYDDGTVSKYQSIPASMWWCIVTMATVGYGDMFPITPGGKVVAAMTVVTGIFFIAFPTAILSNKFLEVYNERKQQKETERKARMVVFSRAIPKRVTNLYIQKEELKTHLDNVKDRFSDMTSQIAEIEYALAMILPSSQETLVKLPASANPNEDHVIIGHN